MLLLNVSPFAVPLSYAATETFTYDANGNLATWTDANGTVIAHSYDIRNRLVNKSYASTKPIGVSGNADGLTNIAYSHDANGNITQTTETYAAIPDDTTVTPTLAAIAGATRTHSRRYDSFNRLDKETDPWGNTLSHNYDAQGNLKATTATTVGGGSGGGGGGTTSSRTASYQYDALNRRVSTVAGAGGGNSASTTVTYDRSSLPVRITYGNGAVSTTDYDSAGRVTGVRHTVAGQAVETTTYTYDANGNRKTETVIQHADLTGNNTQTPETRSTIYTYDSDDRLTNTTASVTSSLAAANGATPAQLAAATAEAASRSYSVAYTYDAAGNRVSEVATPANSGNPTAPSYSKTYTLNPRNQITQIVQTGGSGSATNYGAAAQPTVSGGIGGTSGTGNNAGNPTTGNQGSNTLITPPLLVQTNGTTTLQYDGNGNLTQKVFVPATGGAAPTGPPGSGVNAAPVATTTQYRWNVRDGLSLVSTAITGQPQSAVGQYRYTPEGLRDIKRAVNLAANGTADLVERRSLWRLGASSADFAYLDTDADNNLLGQYESHPNGRSALSRLDGAGSTTYLHTDALGSQTHTSYGASGGLLTSTTQYDAFGNIVSQSGAGGGGGSGNNSNPTTDSKFGYTGHEADAESGLVYFKARYYDPQLGRFIGADAYAGDIGNPMTWNGYGYANGNPLVYVDVDGNESLREMGGIDDKSVDAEHAANAGKNSGWDLFKRAAGYAVKKGLYAAVSISGGGFVSRQDDRREKYDAGKITEAAFDKGTAIDLTVSVVAVATGGAAGSKVASMATAAKLSETGVAAASGAAFAGTANLVEQSGQVFTYAATDGQLGQQYINPGEAALHTAGGAVLGAGIHAATPYVQKAMQAIEGGVRSVTSSIKGQIIGESDKIGVGIADTLTAKSVFATSSIVQEQQMRETTRYASFDSGRVDISRAVARPMTGYGGARPKSAGQKMREGEALGTELTGVVQNHEIFAINGRYRKPDQIIAQDRTTHQPIHIAEIKNVKKQSLTQQLRDYEALVGSTGRVDVYLPPNAKVTGPLQQKFDNKRNPLNRVDLLK